MQLSFFDYESNRSKIQLIGMGDCLPHPDNPRIEMRPEIIERLSNTISKNGYKPEHAILVRSYKGQYQIISGHQRHAAAIKAGLDTIHAWVIDADDQEAHTLLLLENEQSELTPLEKGKHAYEYTEQWGKGKGGAGQTGGIRGYAREHNYSSEVLVIQWMAAYKVVLKTAKNLSSLSHSVLYEISKAPEVSWSALCECAQDEGWTVKQATKASKNMGEISIPDSVAYNPADIFSAAAANVGKAVPMYVSLFDRIRFWLETLPETSIVYEWRVTDESKEEEGQIFNQEKPVEVEVQPRSQFIQLVNDKLPANIKAVNTFGSEVTSRILEQSTPGVRWIPQLSEDEARERLSLQKERTILSSILWTGIVEPNNVYTVQSDLDTTLSAIPKDSIDMMLTDPPWFPDDIHLYQTAVDMAIHGLKPGGFCALYCGKMYLPDIIAMAKELEYVWTFSVFHPYSKMKIQKYCIFENWRPVLLFRKAGGEDRAWAWVQDVVRGVRNKEDHEWQQDLEMPLQLIEAYTNEEDLVFDPFAGGGTTLMAAKQANRQYLGFDNVEENIIAIKRKLEWIDYE